LILILLWVVLDEVPETSLAKSSEYRLVDASEGPHEAGGEAVVAVLLVVAVIPVVQVVAVVQVQISILSLV
jgi:hypothetical protein